MSKGIAFGDLMDALDKPTHCAEPGCAKENTKLNECPCCEELFCPKCKKPY